MTIETKRIYIVVKTYPAISDEYAELVCTAGIQEDGTWIRLYPVPFRMLEDQGKYQKYTWITVNVQRNTKDLRPESYRPDLSSIVVESHFGKPDWESRKRILFNKQTVYTNLQMLIQKAKADGTSLAIFKPAKILDLIIEKSDREWDTERIKSLHAATRQLDLFKSEEQLHDEFRIVRKVPYKFSYKIEDDAGKISTMMIEDWEIGMLYFNCLKAANGDERVAKNKVKEKYLDQFVKKDLHLFLGTTLKFHSIAPNPFIIIGVFCPPMTNQADFDHLL